MKEGRVFTRTMPLVVMLSLMLILSYAQSEVNQGGYTYYGYIPRICGYLSVGRADYLYLDPLSIAKSALISVIAYADDTEVRIYTLPNKLLVKDETINEMEKLFVKLPNGTFFKVHSNKPVTVELLGSGNVDGKELDPSMNEAPQVIGFHPAVDGGYVGKGFIFIAAQGLLGEPYRVLPLEDSEVTVYKEDGSTLPSFNLKANEYKKLSLKPFKGYKVTSTGNIMIQTGETGWDYSHYMEGGYTPSVEGRYTGTRFYTISQTRWSPDGPDGFQISTAEEAKVTIYDVELKRKN